MDNEKSLIEQLDSMTPRIACKTIKNYITRIRKQLAMMLKEVVQQEETLEAFENLLKTYEEKRK